MKIKLILIQIKLNRNPSRTKRTSNLFSEHLFKASLTSTTTISNVPIKGKLFEAHCIRGKPLRAHL